MMPICMRLDRALRVGLVASLVVHAALAGLLPSPFHHDHPLPRVLDVELVEVPPILAPQSSDESPVQSPTPASAPARAASPRPEPAHSPKPPTPAKPVRERTTAVPPSVPETEHLLTHAEPEKAVVSIPAPVAGTASRAEKGHGVRDRVGRNRGGTDRTAFLPGWLPAQSGAAVSVGVTQAG